jgi:hypothetical protein
VVSASLQPARPPTRRIGLGPAIRRRLAVLRRASALLISAGLAGCGSSGHPVGVGPHDFGRLAGYVWTGQVRSVRGSWRVPAITPGSPAGHASTWIGAQVAGSSNQAPFIQVGITEDRVPGAQGTLVSRERAFWSATSLGFHPHFLWPVRPGDRIGARLDRLTSRWRIDIADLSNGRWSMFETTADAQGSFAVAEWLQEDPTASDGSRVPYPRLAATRFDELAVNGAAPRYEDVAAQWMSLPGTSLAPTPLGPGGFSIGRAALSAPGARFLILAARADRAVAGFDAAASRWRRGTPTGEIVAAAARLQRALDLVSGRLRAWAWPTTAEAPVRALAADLGAEARVLAAAASAVRRPGIWTAQYQSAALTTAGQSRLVRRRLHVPELPAPA